MTPKMDGSAKQCSVALLLDRIEYRTELMRKHVKTDPVKNAGIVEFYSNWNRGEIKEIRRKLGVS